MPSAPIKNVSDTARWVAVYRAMEAERPDAIFRDPFARRLAGERGEEIVRSMRREFERMSAVVLLERA
jgi:O-methyltransferase involved in polyketide biosynthesis